MVIQLKNFFLHFHWINISFFSSLISNLLNFIINNHLFWFNFLINTFRSKLQIIYNLIMNRLLKLLILNLM